MMVVRNELNRMGSALALLRITMGIIILVTWYDNLRGGLYTAEGLNGFFTWLFDAENGNGSSLLAVKSYLDSFIVPIAGPFAALQMIAELVMGLALLLGILTRFFALAAAFFFFNIFLSYFGGHEWIWTYVLLIMSAVTLLVGAAGRKWGIDRLLLERLGIPRVPFLW